MKEIFKRVRQLQLTNIIAFFLYFVGRKHGTSTFIDEETVSCGYGKLDNLGIWQYQLPFWFTKNWYK